MQRGHPSRLFRTRQGQCQAGKELGEKAGGQLTSEHQRHDDGDIDEEVLRVSKVSQPLEEEEMINPSPQVETPRKEA